MLVYGKVLLGSAVVVMPLYPYKMRTCWYETYKACCLRGYRTTTTLYTALLQRHTITEANTYSPNPLRTKQRFFQCIGDAARIVTFAFVPLSPSISHCVSLTSLVGSCKVREAVAAPFRSRTYPAATEYADARCLVPKLKALF
jgi:hypothetical protein